MLLVAKVVDEDDDVDDVVVGIMGICLPFLSPPGDAGAAAAAAAAAAIAAVNTRCGLGTGAVVVASNRAIMGVTKESTEAEVELAIVVLLLVRVLVVSMTELGAVVVGLNAKGKPARNKLSSA